MYDRYYFTVVLIDSGGLSEYTIMFRDAESLQIYGLNYKSTNPKLEAVVQNGELYIHPLTRWGCNWYIKGFGSRQVKLNVTVFDNEFSIEGVKPSSLTSDIVKADYGITESDLEKYVETLIRTNPSTTNLDYYKTNFQITIGNWGNYTNAPFSGSNGVLLVFDTGAYKTQIAIARNGEMKKRLFADNNWTAWT